MPILLLLLAVYECVCFFLQFLCCKFIYIIFSSSSSSQRLLMLCEFHFSIENGAVIPISWMCHMICVINWSLFSWSYPFLSILLFSYIQQMFIPKIQSIIMLLCYGFQEFRQIFFIVLIFWNSFSFVQLFARLRFYLK